MSTRTLRRPRRRASARGPNVSLLHTALAFLVAGAAGLLVFFAGSLPIIAVAAGAGVVALLLPRPDWTLGGLALVNMLAVAKSGLAGSPAPSSAAGPGRTVLLGLFGLQAARVAISLRVPVLTLVAPIAPLAGAIVLSIVAAPAPPFEAENAAPFIALLVGSFVLAWPLTSDDDSIRRTITALAVAFATIALLNLAAIAVGTQSAFTETEGVTRFQGLLENPNSVGLLGFGGLTTLVVAGLLSPSPRSRIAFFLLAGLVGLEVLLSLSRAGMGGMLTAVAVLTIGLTRRRASGRFLLGTLIVGGIGILLASGAANSVLESLRLTTISEAGGRAALWPRIFDSAGEQPLLGFGYGSSQDVITSYGAATLSQEGFVGLHAGNIFLDALLEMGVIGLLATVLALALPISLVLTTRFESESRTHRLARIGFLAIIAGGLVDAQGESGFLVPGGPAAIALWFSLAACSAMAHRHRLATSARERAAA